MNYCETELIHLRTHGADAPSVCGLFGLAGQQCL